MALLRKLMFSNNVFMQILSVIIISILVLYIGYMFGKFAWYLSH